MKAQINNEGGIGNGASFYSHEDKIKGGLFAVGLLALAIATAWNVNGARAELANQAGKSAPIGHVTTTASERDGEPCSETSKGVYDCTTELDTARKAIQWAKEDKSLPTFTATVTAYNSVEGQTDSSPCISADGSDICKLKKEGVTACAAAMPFGMKLQIPGFGTCVVTDRLAPKYANRVDIHMGGAEAIGKAKAWGKQKLTITILP